MSTPSGRWKLGFALALVATLLWGTLPIALKTVLSVMDASTIAWYRFLMAMLLLGGYLGAKGRLPRLSNRRWRIYVLLAVAGVAFPANNVTFIMGLDYISPSAAQVVIQLAPSFLLLGAVWLFREQFQAVQWLGFGVLLAGLALFFHDSLGELLSQWTGQTIGVVLLFIAALLWAAFGLAHKSLLSALHSSQSLWLIYCIGIVVLLPLAEPSQALAADAGRLAVLVYCGLVTVTGLGSFGEALAHWEASRVSAVVATCPLMTVALTEVAARLFPGYVAAEHLDGISIAGAGGVVAGSMVTALSGKLGRSREVELP